MEMQDHVTRNAVVHVPRGAGRMNWMSNDTYETKLSAAETNGVLSAVDAFVPPGGGPVPHRHDLSDEVFHLLEGELEFTKGDETFVAEAGAVVFIPRGVRHGFRNQGRTPARMFLLHTPAGPEGVFLEGGSEVVAGQLPPEMVFDERLLAVLARYDTHIA